MKYIASFMVVVILGGLIYFGPEIKEHFGTRYASTDREITRVELIEDALLNNAINRAKSYLLETDVCSRLNELNP